VLEPDLMRLGEPGLQRHCEQLLTWLAPACDHSKSSWWTHLVESYRRARSARAQPTEPWALWLAIKGDGVVRCPSMRLAELQRSSGGSVFAYLFCWTSPFMGGVLGACHTLDLPFLLGDLDDPRTVTFTGTGPEARRLAERMQDAWIAFARTGNPSHTGIGEWPSYDSAQRATMILDRDCHIEVAPLEEERSVWDEVIQDRHASPNPYARLDAGKLQDRPRSLRTSPTRSVKPVRSK
jgi:carboxylesterase type B